MASPCWKKELLRGHPGISSCICSIRPGSSFTNISQTNIQNSHPSIILEGCFTIIHPVSHDQLKEQPGHKNLHSIYQKNKQKKVCNKGKENLQLEVFQSPASQQEPVPAKLWPARNDFLLLLPLTASLQDVDTKEAEVFKGIKLKPQYKMWV